MTINNVAFHQNFQPNLNENDFPVEVCIVLFPACTTLRNLLSDLSCIVKQCTGIFFFRLPLSGK